MPSDQDRSTNKRTNRWALHIEVDDDGHITISMPLNERNALIERITSTTRAGMSGMPTDLAVGLMLECPAYIRLESPR